MTDLELIYEIRRADNPKALELLRGAIGRGRMEGSREMAERLSEENARLTKALRPFAELRMDGPVGFLSPEITAARAVLAGQQPAQPEEKK